MKAFSPSQSYRKHFNTPTKKIWVTEETVLSCNNKIPWPIRQTIRFRLDEENTFINVTINPHGQNFCRPLVYHLWEGLDWWQWDRRLWEFYSNGGSWQQHLVPAWNAEHQKHHYRCSFIDLTTTHSSHQLACSPSFPPSFHLNSCCSSL